MTIGGYEVVRLIGKGGMSEVYEVENKRLGSRHALKFFTYEKDIPEVRERFLAEGRILALLSHPHIVKVSDFGMDDATKRPFIVMDLILDPDGKVQSLADLPAGSADEELIARWYEDLREGLRYVHGKGIVHRDLKLQNVLVGPDGHVVLTDFGISKVTDEKISQTVDPVQTVVRIRDGRNTVMGSLGYMAPELEMGLPASPESDYYALGVIIYKLLTGAWCDVRTDVLTALETYDPVWRRILPKLLHGNPQGRECISFDDEKKKDREELEWKQEERYLREKARGHLARHVARYVGAGLAVCLLVMAFGWFKYQSDKRLWQVRLRMGGASGLMVDFDELFNIPAEARSEEKTNDEGRLIMPSREDIVNTRIDALILTHLTFATLQAGKISLERAIADLEALREGFSPDAEAPFDKWPENYVQVGTDETMYWMLGKALDKLNGMAE
ncbi:MAG: serine/threonine protein kinase [Kiritimatiellae bacterium]|nr:serine/threonine protein kinase [Kiritimatiellia bacterium]